MEPRNKHHFLMRRGIILFSAKHPDDLDGDGNIDDPNHHGDIEFYPERIDYTGNKTRDEKPLRSIVFQYEDRTDRFCGFDRIWRKSQNHLLVDILNLYQNKVVHSYHLDYKTSPTTGKSLLTTLSECDKDWICKSPTRFEWETGVVELGQAIPTKVTYPDYPHTDDIEDGYSAAFPVALDINGDGAQDLVYSKPSSPSDPRETWHVLLGNPQRSMTSKPFLKEIDTKLASHRCPASGEADGPCWKTHHGISTFVVDLSDDGKDELMIVSPVYSTTVKKRKPLPLPMRRERFILKRSSKNLTTPKHGSKPF